LNQVTQIQGSQMTQDPALASRQQLISRFLRGEWATPYLLLATHALEGLRDCPSDSVDTVITSPPYWGHREYGGEHEIGGESTVAEYIQVLGEVFLEVKRVLKPTGSLWLNIGDAYEDKRLLSIPWRLAIHMQDTQGWILRNDVIWNKMKGSPDNSKDKLRNVHEFLFHFVKQKTYYYDADAIRNTIRPAQVKGGVVTTGTGVSGINYKRQIARSPDLSDPEKQNALQALEDTLSRVGRGEIPDFRMIIRGQQRATHSASVKVSGRAAELARKGFCILPYHSKGSKPGDVWDIIPEDEWRKDSHCAPYPRDLCLLPIRATCPVGGLVLDPFLGTGTTAVVTLELQRRIIGFDLYQEFIDTSTTRLIDRYGYMF